MSTPPEPATTPSPRPALLAFATFAGLVALAEVGFRTSTLGRGLSHESAYLTKSENFSEGPGADVLVIGDSRILHGFHPLVAEGAVLAERGETVRAYNAGLSGAPPMAHLAWVRRALSLPHRPRVVVLSISPYMFGTLIATAAARESLATMYRVQDVPAMLRAGASLEDAASVVNGRLFSLYRFRPRVLEVLFRSGRPYDAASTGLQGYYDNGFVDASTQDYRARGRAEGYHNEIHRPEARLTNEHRGYFEEALRELRDAHITTLVINSPSSSQIARRYTPDTLYDEHTRYVRAQAARFGASWADAMQAPVVDDTDYTDGDHLSSTGAQRWTAWLMHTHVIPLLGGPLPAPDPRCRVLFDFEQPQLVGWRAEGLSDPVVLAARQHQNAVVGQVGARFVTSFGRGVGDGSTGTLTSPEFLLDTTQLRLRVAGGSGPQVAAELVVDEQVVRSAHGDNDETLREVRWDVRAWQGRTARLRLRDASPGGWGHLEMDDVRRCP